MKKRDIEGNYLPYPYEEDKREIDYPDEHPNLMCDCGNTHFEVCWWDYPFTGGFCKVICTKCGNSLLLIDDFA